MTGARGSSWELVGADGEHLSQRGRLQECTSCHLFWYELAAMHDQGYAIVADTHTDRKFNIFGWKIDVKDGTNDPVYSKHKLVAGHTYFVESVDPVAGTVTIRNPWGAHEPPIILTEAEYRKAFADISLNPIKPDP